MGLLLAVGVDGLGDGANIKANGSYERSREKNC